MYLNSTQNIFDLNLYRKDCNNTIRSKQRDDLNQFGNCGCYEGQQLAL